MSAHYQFFLLAQRRYVGRVGGDVECIDLPWSDFSLSPRRGPTKELLREAWLDFLRFAMPFISDTAKGALILLGLAFFGWILHLGKLFGLRDEYAESFEKMHFWLNYGAISILGFDFLSRLARAAFKGEKR